MEVLEAIRERSSVRAYRDEEVPEELLERVLEAARWAPSAGNLQAWSVVVVTDPGLRESLSRASLGQTHVHQAPVDLVFFADQERSGARYGEKGRQFYALQDATIAATHAVLAAEAVGLGTCWVGAMREGEIEELLDVPKGFSPVAILTLGYPEGEPLETSRRPLEEHVHKNRW